MKYFKILLLCAAFTVIGYACKKSFLDKAPVGSLDPSALANKNGVNGLLIGAYSELDGEGDINVVYGPSGNWASSADNWIYGNVCGTEAHKGSSAGDQPEIVPLETFHPTTTNPDVWGKWQVVYDGVSRSNDVIRTAALAKDLSADELAQILAEARALRAWYHFEAKKMWNNIPFVDETVTYGANNYFVANDVDAWPKIEADLQVAVSTLPLTQPQVGRLNKYSVEAILAKVYMFEQKFTDAKPLLEDIINSGKYSLGHFHDNFNILTKNGSESVFSAQSSVNDGSNGSNGNEGDVLSFPYGGLPGICCGFDQPTQFLVNRFKTDATTGLPDLDNFANTDVTNDMGLLSSAPFTPYAGTLDSRLDWTVGRRGLPYLDWGLHAGNDWIRAQSDGGPYSPFKDVYPVALLKTGTDQNYWGPITSALNVNLIRYADVLLLDAEVEVEVGTVENARALVNQVRARAADPAGWPKQYLDNANPQGGFSNVPAANYKVGLYTTAWTDQVTARKAVRFERALELAMEGHRFFDIVRWGIAQAETTSYFAHEKTLVSYLGQGAFTTGVNEYFPIPQQEIDKSGGKLIQNPGYH